ncbi:hypothetical protein [Brevibacterium litoralis]|uniref:hypothetical protein n=1 Tax=Brevibacterium litoralis TaxID=3138935 RepID=UPI0032ED593A
MTPSRSSMTYASALNRNELYASFGLRSDIPTLLEDDEEVLLVCPGIAGNFPHVLIVTRERVVLAKVAGPFRKKKILRQAPAGAITGVEYGGRLFSLMKVRVRGGRDMRMMPHRKADATRFHSEFEHLLRTGRLP